TIVCAPGSADAITRHLAGFKLASYPIGIIVDGGSAVVRYENRAVWRAAAGLGRSAECRCHGSLHVMASLPLLVTLLGADLAAAAGLGHCKILLREKHGQSSEVLYRPAGVHVKRE